MDPSSPAVNERIAEALGKYANLVYRICYLYLGRSPDADDVFQEVFLKLMNRNDPFDSQEHEKAWLIRVTANQCKDLLKSFWRTRVDIADTSIYSAPDSNGNELMEAVLSLPRKYKDVVYLYYYEEYSVAEIAHILSRRENTIYSDLHRARALLRKCLGGKADEYSV